MDGGRSYYGGGGGGGGAGGRHHGGGGRHHRGRGRGGRGGRFRHQPYNNRSRGPRRPGNRFAGSQQVDPQTAMIRQVSSFVSRVGEFKNLRESDNPSLRSVEFTTSSNINDLVNVLCAQDKMEMLFKQGGDKPQDKAGKLVHVVISCASALPLQTPCYAALTLAVHEQVKGSPHEGFASRCVNYTMFHLARDLDTILLTGQDQTGKAICRLKLLVRYLAILGGAGMVKPFEGEDTVDPNRMTVFGLLSVLVDAATAAVEQHSNPTATCILASLVLSTLPYIIESVPRDIVLERLVKPIETLLESYKSSFAPGVGTMSLLLKEPQAEDDDEADDEEEEDDDEEEESSAQICDSLQDLLRASQRWRKEGEVTKFSLPLDAPWKGLVRRPTPNPEGGETESHPIVFTEEPIYLKFSEECQSLNLLVAGTESAFKLQCVDLEGTVFGRLPIFGSPADPDDDDDDEEEMEEGATKNEHLQAFAKGFSLMDRYFVAETMRDCLICHESCVNATGMQHGSAKTAAEELLSVSHVFSGDNPSAGMEYAIVETIFALLAQSSEHSPLRHIFLSRVLLELTRLEPSRLSPALAVAMTNLFQDYLPALVPTARENFSRWFAFHLVNTDYQWPSAYWQVWEPYATSTKPSSRGSFIRRALNLMAENVADPAIIVDECFSSAKSLTNELLGRSGAPASNLEEGSPMASLESELHRRIWDADEDPTVLHDYLTGEEVSTGLGTAASSGADQANGGSFPRTDTLIRVLVNPASQMHESIKTCLEKSDEGDDGMVDDKTLSKDLFGAITDAIARYKQTLQSAIAKDAESLSAAAGGEKGDLITLGGAFLLRRVQSVASFSSGLLEGIVSCLVKNGAVSALAVLRWALGDFGDAVSVDVLPRWWFFASEAAQESVSALENEITAGGIMTVDGGGMSSDSEFGSKSVNGLTQMLQYAVKRVCSLLVSGQGEGKVLSPMQVELLEGMKTLNSNCKTLVLSVLTHSVGMRKAMTPVEAQAMISKSEMTGSSLASLCAGHDASSAANLLHRIIEKP